MRGKAWKKLLFCVALAAVPGLPALAQSRIPAHEITRDDRTGACRVRLVPSETQGEDPPALLVVTEGRAKSDTFGLQAAQPLGTESVELVFSNLRQRFAAVPPARAQVLTQSVIWRTMQTGFDQELPFFLTAKSAGGRYASARYDAVDPKGILKILETQCGYGSPALSAKSPEERRAIERALRLNSTQWRHIHYVLNSRYGNRFRDPGGARGLAAREREFLLRYTQDAGVPQSRYLTEALAQRLLRERFAAAAPRRSDKEGYSRHGDWESYRMSRDRCVVSTSARAWNGLLFYVRPEIQFMAKINIPGDRLYFNMVTPNPFRAGTAVAAWVDGIRYPLQQKDGWVLPARKGDGVSDEVMKAIRRGRVIEFRGTAAETGRPAMVQFSASGFTAGFERMMRRCRRPGLQEWFR